MLSKLETGGGGGGSNWSAKNDPYKYAAAIKTGPRRTFAKRRFSSFAIPIKIQTGRRIASDHSSADYRIPKF